MANEAVKRYSESTSGDVIIDYTVVDAMGIEKGTFLKLLDARVASTANTQGEPCAGIAAREKVSGDGRTQLSVHKKGYFDVLASGAITVGDPLILKGIANRVMAATSGFASGAAVIGYAEETASDAETFVMRLDL